GPEGGRLRGALGAERLQRQRPGGVRRGARRPGVLLRAGAGARQAQRQLPAAGGNPGQVQRPAGARLRHVRAGAEGEFGRDQGRDRRLIAPGYGSRPRVAGGLTMTRVRRRVRWVVAALLFLAALLYTGSYLYLSRRGADDARRHGLRFFLYVPVEEVMESQDL